MQPVDAMRSVVYLHVGRFRSLIQDGGAFSFPRNIKEERGKVFLTCWSKEAVEHNT